MTDWPRTDLHAHATFYRLHGARPEMTVANILRLNESDYQQSDVEQTVLKDTERRY